MFGKDSISFGSIRQSSVWHNQDPIINRLSSNNQVNFHQFPPNSTQLLDDSSIKRFPALKSNAEINKLMQKNLDVLCLLQAAEIKRLITNLQEYQVKFKQIQHQPLDRQSYQIQIRQLAQTCHNLQKEKNQIQNKMQKMKQFVVKQNAEMQNLLDKMHTQQKQSYQNIKLLNQQLSQIAFKYEKSLETINKLMDDNQILTVDKQSLQQQINMLKQHFVQVQERRQAFDSQRIHQIQRMRQSYEAKINQQNLEFQTKIQIKSNEIHKNLQEQNNQLMRTLSDVSHQLKLTEMKFISSMEENKKLQAQFNSLHSQLVEQRQRSNIQRKDFDEKFKIFTQQTDRLNEVVKNKQSQFVNLQNIYKNQITQKNQQVSSLNQKIEQFEDQRKQYQKVIDERSNHLQGFHKKIIQDQQVIQQLQKQIQELLYQLKQSQLRFKNKQSENITIQSLKKQYEYRINFMQKSHENRIRQCSESQRLLKQNMNLLHNKIQSIMLEASEINKNKQEIIKSYQQKIRQYFQVNQNLKNNLSELCENYQKMKKQRQEVQLKLKGLQKQKIAIEKQLQHQIIKFTENNHKAYSILQQHTHKVQLTNYQKQYAKNHLRLLEQVSSLNRKILQKDTQNQNLLQQIKQLKTYIEQLQRQLSQIHIFLKKQSQQKSIKLDHINENIEIHLNQKQKQILHSNQQNRNLVQRLSYADQQLKQSEVVTEQAIKSAAENQKLKYNIEGKDQQIKKLYEEINNLTAQLQSIQLNYKILYERDLSFQDVLGGKDKLIQEMTHINSIFKQQILKMQKENQTIKQDSKKSVQIPQNDKKIQQMLLQFNQLNEALLIKINEIQRKQTQTIQRLHCNQSQVSQVFSFNPSVNNKSKKTHKTMQNTKDNVQSNSQFVEIITQLNDRIQQYEEKILILQKNIQSVVQKCKSLQTQKVQLSMKLNTFSMSQSQKQNQSLAYEKLYQLNMRLSNQNSSLISQNSNLVEELRYQQQKIKQVSKIYQQLNSLQSKYLQKQSIFTSKQTQIRTLYHEVQILKKQLSNHEGTTQNYNQKIIKLQEELDIFRKKQMTIETEKKNLKRLNYDFKLQIEKDKVTKGKIQVLNHQLQRLQRENIDLIQQLDKCKFQISQDSCQQRRINELLTLLVITFAEIQSLRSRVRQKDIQINAIRKSNLNQYKMF